jgi:hypothetical protein
MLVSKYRVSNSVAVASKYPIFIRAMAAFTLSFTQAVAIIAVTKGTYADHEPSDQTAARQWAW